MGWSAFRPTGNTITIAVTVTASAGAQAPSFSGETQSNNYLVTNAGAQGVFLAYGPASTLATVATGLYLLPGSSQTFTFGNNSFFSLIAPTGTSTVYVTPGDGL